MGLMFVAIFGLTALFHVALFGGELFKESDCVTSSPPTRVCVYVP